MEIQKTFRGNGGWMDPETASGWYYLKPETGLMANRQRTRINDKTSIILTRHPMRVSGKDVYQLVQDEKALVFLSTTADSTEGREE